jgi:hypothetical protein
MASSVSQRVAAAREYAVVRDTASTNGRVAEIASSALWQLSDPDQRACGCAGSMSVNAGRQTGAGTALNGARLRADPSASEPGRADQRPSCRF